MKEKDMNKDTKKKGMNKKMIIAIATVVTASVLGLGIYQSSASQADPKLSIDDITQLVSDQYPGTITEMELDKELNKTVYEIEVISNGKEYDLKLDGNTGEVLKLKEKSVTNKEQIVVTEDADDKVEVQSDKQESAKGTEKAVIDAKEAIDIAQKEFSGTVTDLELDDDDGRLIYEIEIKKGKEEADIDIDAYTGEVLVIEIDTDDDDD